MSTRSQLEFRDSKDGEAVARIYHHCDGYPTGRLPNIMATWTLAMSAYDQPGYTYRKENLEGYISDLAAFYIVANKTGAGDVEIDNLLHGDIEFFYILWPERNKLMVDVQEPMPGTFMDFDPERTKSIFVGTVAGALEHFGKE